MLHDTPRSKHLVVSTDRVTDRKDGFIQRSGPNFVSDGILSLDAERHLIRNLTR